MTSTFLGELTDIRHGEAFREFTKDYLAHPTDKRPAYEALFVQKFGTWFLDDWRAWRTRHGYP